MPHSSGGGSHGGGSHGGHGGGGGGGSSRHISHVRFPNSVRYRYYHKGEERFFYSEPNFKPWSPANLLLILFYLPFFFAGGFIIKDGFKKSFPKDIDINTQIMDEANILESTYTLSKAMDAFGEKTGISPAFLTINESEWAGQYDTLESYAYNRYLTEFPDEMHWLIVYSVPTDGINWSWEGMQGDDTDPILTTEITDKFNSDLQSMLENNNYTVGSAVSSAFSHISEIVKKPSLLSQILPGFFFIGFSCFHAFFMMGLYRIKYRHCELAPEEPQSFGYNDTPNRSTSTIPEYVSQQSNPNFNEQPVQASYQNPFEQPAQTDDEPEMESIDLFSSSANSLSEPSMPTEPTIAQATVTCRYCGTSYESYHNQCPNCGVATTYNT